MMALMTVLPRFCHRRDSVRGANQRRREMRRSISMLLAAAVAVTGAATSFVPAQGAMVAIVPPVKSDVAADIVPVEAEWARQYRQYNQRRWYPRHGGGWDGRHGWRGG